MIRDQEDAAALLKDEPVKWGFLCFSDEEIGSESPCNLLKVLAEPAGCPPKYIFSLFFANVTWDS